MGFKMQAEKLVSVEEEDCLEVPILRICLLETEVLTADQNKDRNLKWSSIRQTFNCQMEVDSHHKDLDQLWEERQGLAMQIETEVKTFLSVKSKNTLKTLASVVSLLTNPRTLQILP